MNEFLQALITIGFLAGMMWAMLKFMLRDIHNDLVELKAGQKRLEERMDKSNVRIDHLYEICVDILKTRR